MRVIELAIEPDVLERLYAQTGGTAAFEAAIGRLALFHYGFKKVVVSASASPDVVASYMKDDGSVGYTVAALWDAGRFTFHS